MTKMSIFKLEPLKQTGLHSVQAKERDIGEVKKDTESSNETLKPKRADGASRHRDLSISHFLPPWPSLSSNGWIQTVFNQGRSSWETTWGKIKGTREAHQDEETWPPDTRLRDLQVLIGRAHSLEKTLMLGKFEDRRRRGWQRMR